jgi:hypothetical protein
MFKARFVLLSLVGVLSAFAMLTSTASAKIAFLWKVGGKFLEKTTETRAFLASSDGKIFDFHASVAGVPLLLLSNTISVGNTGVIRGGKPGTNEETVTFSNVVVDEPAKCTAETGGIPKPEPGTVTTKPLLTQIVESQKNGEPLILFKPEVGTVFVAIKFLNKGAETCSVNGAEGEVTGNILAEELPQLTEALTQDLDFEANTKEFLLSPGGGTVEKAGLSFAGGAATLTGLALILLETHEKFGAF